MGFSIKQATPSEVRVELFGPLDERGAQGLERDLEMALSKLTPKAFSVVINSMGMTDCAMNARETLVRIQARLAKVAARTAWIDDRPKFRGLALWVMHLAADGNAKALATMEQVREWLVSSVDRVRDAQVRAEARS